MHRLALSAWAFAGLSGNRLSEFVLKQTESYDAVLYVILALYVIATVISMWVVKPEKVHLVNNKSDT